MKQKKIYLASPLGFSEAGRKFYYEELIPLIIKRGLDVIDPWKLTPPADIKKTEGMEYGKEKKAAWQKLNNLMGERNAGAIKASDGMLAILDGVDIDSGTASEIGYAYGLGKIIAGYRGDFRLSSDNEGSIVNLQVEYFIRNSGGEIVTSIEDFDKILGLFNDSNR